MNKIKTIGIKRLFRTAASVMKHGFTLMALLDTVKNSAASLKDDSVKLTYKDFYFQSLTCAHYLNANYGIGAGSRVVIVCANSISFIRTLFGVSGLGADIFLLNPDHKKNYFTHFLSGKNIDLIICDKSLIAELSSVNIPMFCPEKEFEFKAKLYLGNIVTRKRGSLTILSSGSKGTPKTGKRKFSASAFIDPLVDIVEKLRLSENQLVLISVPVFHGYGIAALLLSIFLGKDIRLTKKFETLKTTTILEEEKTDCWIVVPLMIQKVFAGNFRSQHLKKIISGGDLLPQPVIENLIALSVKIYNLYGTSETGVCTVATNEDLVEFPGTIGKEITGVKTKIANDIKDSVSGQLFVKCRWSSDDSTGYIATGDMVSVNDRGYYFYKGRKDDMIIIGGENIYPAELEHIIYQYPGIIWVHIEATPDEYNIKRIHVKLAVSSGIEFCEEKFMKWLSGQVPNFMMPRFVNVLNHEPVSKLM